MNLEQNLQIHRDLTRHTIDQMVKVMQDGIDLDPICTGHNARALTTCDITCMLTAAVDVAICIIADERDAIQNDETSKAAALVTFHRLWDRKATWKEVFEQAALDFEQREKHRSELLLKVILKMNRAMRGVS